MRRNLLLLTVTLMVFNSSFAQVFRFGVPNLEAEDMQKWNFGFSLGIDVVDANLKTKENYGDLLIDPDTQLPSNRLMQIYTKPMPAFNVGIVANLRMGKYFDLRFIPGFSIAHDIDIYYVFKNDILNPDPRKNGYTKEILRKIECHFINFPLFIKFKSSRMHNVRLYVIGGAQIGVNMMSGKNQKLNITYHYEKADVIPILKPYDIQAKGGFGFDFYTTYFKLSTEFKVSMGVIDLMEKPKKLKYQNQIDYYLESPIYQGIKNMKSKTFTISFIFE